MSSTNARHATTSDEHFMILSSLAEGGSVSKLDQQESLQKSTGQQMLRLKATEDMGECECVCFCLLVSHCIFALYYDVQISPLCFIFQLFNCLFIFMFLKLFLYVCFLLF